MSSHSFTNKQINLDLKIKIIEILTQYKNLKIYQHYSVLKSYHNYSKFITVTVFNEQGL